MARLQQACQGRSQASILRTPRRPKIRRQVRLPVSWMSSSKRHGTEFDNLSFRVGTAAWRLVAHASRPRFPGSSSSCYTAWPESKSCHVLRAAELQPAPVARLMSPVLVVPYTAGVTSVHRRGQDQSASEHHLLSSTTGASEPACQPYRLKCLRLVHQVPAKEREPD